jgi:hypothetical protein
MAKQKLSVYEVMVYVAYAYFILLGGIDLILSYLWGGVFSYIGFFVVAVFALQAWHKHKLLNLILGVLALACSIFASLEFLSKAHKIGFNFFVGVMSGISLGGILMGIVLIFSYTKLSFKDHQ